MVPIKYIAFYDNCLENSCRNVSAAAVNKVQYFIHSLSRIGVEVEVLSVAWLKKNTSHEQKKEIASEVNVQFLPNLNYFRFGSIYLNAIIANVWLLWMLIFRVNRGEKIMVYHSLVIMPAIFLAKITGYVQVILEVEELYTCVGEWSRMMKRVESLYVRIVGSQYILSTELLASAIPSDAVRIIVHGAYSIPSNVKKRDSGVSGRVKVLYAGIIDKQKMGAYNAVRASVYLNDCYEMHLIGFGDVEDLLLEIDSVNKTGKCKVYFDGFLTGPSLEQYCSDFHIGLSTQTTQGAYVYSSFPSKILTYLSYGLRVVSPYLECIASSAVADFVTYYHDDSPEEIARAIKMAKSESSFDSVNELNKLDKKFCSELSNLFGYSTAFVHRDGGV